MQLPKKKSPPERTNPRVLLLYGPPKVGKTTKIAELDDCLILDLEKGSLFLEAMKLDCSSPQLFREAVIELKKGYDSKDPNKRYKYLALDTITRLEDFCEVYATEEYRSKPIGKSFSGSSVLELPMGAGYGMLREQITTIISMLGSITDNLILIGHTKDKFIGTDPKGNNVSSVELDLKGKNSAITMQNADAVGYLYRENVKNDAGEKVAKLFVSFESKEGERAAGARCNHLKGKKMELVWSDIYV
jgi:hypothetical protein